MKLNRNTAAHTGLRHILAWVKTGQIHELEQGVGRLNALLADLQKERYEKEKAETHAANWWSQS